jgi:hypothetical protein
VEFDQITVLEHEYPAIRRRPRNAHRLHVAAHLALDALVRIPAPGDAYAEFQTLANFFNARQGNYDSFLYTDPTD